MYLAKPFCVVSIRIPDSESTGSIMNDVFFSLWCFIRRGWRFVGVALSIFLTVIVVLSSQGLPADQIDLRPGKKIVLKESIFDTGKSTINPTNLPFLQKIAQYLRGVSELELEITGHTDNQGNALQNAKLSFDRAMMVRTILSQAGVPADRIRARGLGDQSPIADNNTESGRSQNRRVEIVGVSATSKRVLTANDGKPMEPDGEVTFVQNQVKTLAPWEKDWQMGLLRLPIYEYHKINTLENARVEVTFKDQSKLKVSENSLVVIYRPTQSLQPEGKQKEHIGLVKGNLWLKLQAAKQQDQFLVKTVAGEVMMSNAIKIGVDEQGRSLVSVHEGTAQVKSDAVSSDAITVAENFGTRMAANIAPETPRQLPPIPELLEPQLPQILHSDAMKFTWQKQSARTRFEVIDAVTSKQLYTVMTAHDYATISLHPGKYRVLLTGIDSIGLESKGSERVLTVLPAVERQTFHWLEFILFVVSGATAWTGLLLKRKDFWWFALALVVLATWLLLR